MKAKLGYAMYEDCESVGIRCAHRAGDKCLRAGWDKVSASRVAVGLFERFP